MESSSSKEKDTEQPEYSGPILYYNDTVLDHFTMSENWRKTKPTGTAWWETPRAETR